METDRHIDRNFYLNPVFLGVQLNIKLIFILIIVCQWYKDTFSLFFCRNIDTMVSITICSFCNRKACCFVCVLLYVIFPCLSAQVTMQFLCIYLYCDPIIIFLHIAWQSDGFLIQYGFERITYFQYKTNIMFFFF